MLFSSEGSGFPADPDPRGTHVLVVATREEPHREQLLLAPLDGGPAVTLSPPSGKIRNPSFAPDGSAVLFESDGESFRDLYRVARDGSARVRLTDSPKGSFEPSLSPDGQRLLFASSRDGNAELYVAGADGSDPRRLTDDRGDDTHPRWAADGSILWIATRDRSRRVWAMDADGSDPRPLRGDGAGLDLAFAASADGRVAVTVQDGDALRIEIVGPKGTVVVDGEGPDEHPAWSADGQWLAFASSRAGNPDIWVTNGVVLEPLTTDPAPDWLPRFLPTP